MVMTAGNAVFTAVREKSPSLSHTQRFPQKAADVPFSPLL
jgi:hypothetical protein